MKTNEIGFVLKKEAICRGRQNATLPDGHVTAVRSKYRGRKKEQNELGNKLKLIVLVSCHSAENPMASRLFFIFSGGEPEQFRTNVFSNTRKGKRRLATETGWSGRRTWRNHIFFPNVPKFTGKICASKPFYGRYRW